MDAIRIVPDYRNSRFKEIFLAGGCFWGVQAYMERIHGVEFTEAGYANGMTGKADYYSLSKTGHAETVYIAYDPGIISLEGLLRHFFGIIDPTSMNRQGNDIGIQYRSGIYYVDASDRPAIEAAAAAAQAECGSRSIVTEIQPLKNYIHAEAYHQDYLIANPEGYCHINLDNNNTPGGVPPVYEKDYPRPSVDKIREKLTREQFGITQDKMTEPAFQNLYWNNKEEGLYVDVVTGEPLFSSAGKFDSGTGWPSFTRPYRWYVVKHYADLSYGMERIEVRSRSGDSHLGHLFRDGPRLEGGLRYCINSGALDFIRSSDAKARGYS